MKHPQKEVQVAYQTRKVITRLALELIWIPESVDKPKCWVLVGDIVSNEIHLLDIG